MSCMQLSEGLPVPCQLPLGLCSHFPTVVKVLIRAMANIHDTSIAY